MTKITKTRVLGLKVIDLCTMYRWISLCMGSYYWTVVPLWKYACIIPFKKIGEMGLWCGEPICGIYSEFITVNECDGVTQPLAIIDHSECSSLVVQGELSPKIDDDIDSVLGLAVFYQRIRRAAFNHKQTQHIAVFSTEMFALSPSQALPLCHKLGRFGRFDTVFQTDNG